MQLRFSVMVMTAALAACGGGGGGDDAPAPASETSSNLPVISATPVSIPNATYAADSAERGGWQILQEARGLCGFGLLTQDKRLDDAALAHSRYQTNQSKLTGDSLLSHFETVSSDPNYTGYEPWDRTQAQGYGNQVAEIIAATVWRYNIANPPTFPTPAQRGADSMLNLLNTVYHLIGAMYEGADVGFGADLLTIPSGSERREEFRFGSLNGYQTRRLLLGQGTLVTYPCQGSVNVPTTFVPAYESPNPFPAMTSPLQVVGPPIYLKVDSGQVLRLTSQSITRSDGVTVGSTVLTRANDPAKEIGYHEVFVVPSTTLQANTRYSISLTGTINGSPFVREFSMLTGS